MRAMLVLRLVTVSLAVLFAVETRSAFAVCERTVSPEDRAAFDALNERGWLSAGYVNWFRDHYNLQHDDWDEGWGWTVWTDPERAFTKMVVSGRLLGSGISRRMGLWQAVKVFRSPSGQGWASRPTVAFANDGKAHVFIRNEANELTQYHYDPFDQYWNQSLQRENITQTRLNGADPVPLFSGNVVVVKPPDTDPRMRVLGLPGQAPGNVVLFEQLFAGAIGGWRSTILTPPHALGQFFRISNPAVLVRLDGTFHAFGANSEGELIQYSWRPGFGTYGLTAVPKGAPQWRISSSSGSVIAVEGRDDSMHVFAINDPVTENPATGLKGDLLRFVNSRNVDGRFGWTTENVSQRVGMGLATYSGLVARRVSERGWVVYGRQFGGDLVRYALGPVLSFFPFDVDWVWRAQNLTDTATVLPIPVGVPEGFKIGPVFDAPETNEIVGLSYNSLAYFFKSGSVWNQTNATASSSVSSALVNPVSWPRAVRGPGLRNHVFSVNSEGYLLHYENDGLSPMWSVEQPHLPRYVADADYLMDTSLEVRDSGNGHRHVVALSRNRRHIVHFVATDSHSWHTAHDYERWAAGRIFSDFKYVPQDSEESYAHARWGPVITDLVWMRCPAFDGDTDPAHRGGAILHEAAHHHYHENHVIVNGDKKDRWHHHGLRDVPWDTLHPDHHKHSMYQIEVEFLADIAEFPEEWIPVRVFQTARDVAGLLIDARFTNTVGWTVGEPRPF